MAKKIFTHEEAQLRMASLCSRSEQCESDIRRKLISMELQSSQISDILSFLKDEKFIDNSRYAKSFANDKAKFAYWGPNKIKASLVAKHIPSSIINEAISTIEEDIWKEAAMKNASGKARYLNLILPGDEGYQNRKKLYVYLIGRGFPSPLANKAVKIMRNLQEGKNQ